MPLRARPLRRGRPLASARCASRVFPISQFDGGPLAKANCTLAAGAMLALIAFGVVTTGTVLRENQDDQVGGAGLDDLTLARGAPITTRSRPARWACAIWLAAGAGYGVVIQGKYSEVPPALRLQRDFLGGHAIDLDGYFAGDADTPAAFYVIDPLGRPDYPGSRWPAPVIEAFGCKLSGTARIWSAWAPPLNGLPGKAVKPDVPPVPPSGGNQAGESTDETGDVPPRARPNPGHWKATRNPAG